MSLAALRLRVESEREELLARFNEWLDDPRWPLGGMTEEHRAEWRDLRDLYRSHWRELQATEEQTARLATRAERERAGEKRRRAS